MIHRCFFVPLLALVAGALPSVWLNADEPVDLEPYRPASLARWSDAMREFETRNEAETHPEDSVLVVGSSSVRLWRDIEDDMKPYHAIGRGFGGSRWSDVAVFAERLITPHRFRAAVFFVANDITGGEADKSPDEIVALFQHVRDVVRRHNPDAPVFYIAVTPTERRWEVWPEIRAGNEAVRAYCQRTPQTHFIGTESIYLNAQGRPRSELFINDRLHLNDQGYVRWAAAIKSHLDSVLGGAATGSNRAGEAERIDLEPGQAAGQ
jgi:lysophospholipase L1-like esterase